MVKTEPAGVGLGGSRVYDRKPDELALDEERRARKVIELVGVVAHTANYRAIGKYSKSRW